MVSITEGILAPSIMPLITFIIGGAISFSTGTSYGTIAVLMPIVMPIVYNVSISAGIDPLTFVFPTIGAVLAGAIFGDHCSPISDTTIMSSMFTGSDHIDHVKTQIPYAILAGIGTLVGYIGVALRIPSVINILVGVLVAIIIFKFISRPINIIED